MESDFVFVAPMIHMANIMSKWTKNLFVFSFDHQSSLAPQPNWLGVPHGRDLFYLFGCPLVGHEIYSYSDTDIIASKYMMTMWSNFVKFGYLTLNDYLSTLMEILITSFFDKM
ncbi:hypothetical protein KUTeg_016058 [Tegillarca granosa]|uniref:Carboxylesterase type B domain-containing protein n=1 Tax=Tegillarca granosa TaxID=220873 RepID=A0ABQ9EJS2_TEGGR|nr:hypothetical protein KUTeg_016058 [Tegillarca granosa]